MIAVSVAVILLVVFVLVAIRIGISKEQLDTGEPQPIIHKSGIYSIVRKNPREIITGHKPSPEELRKYLSSQNEDMKSNPLSDHDKEELIKSWCSGLEKSIAEIEEGDKEGVEFYYYKFSTDDPVCLGCITKGQFVTREQIYQYPKVIPPFHLGCSCELRRYPGVENLRDTAVVGMTSLFTEKRMPSIPDWKIVIKN